jgi:hypothetical protein
MWDITKNYNIVSEKLIVNYISYLIVYYNMEWQISMRREKVKLCLAFGAVTFASILFISPLVLHLIHGFMGR